jgi:hypothetical protein
MTEIIYGIELSIVSSSVRLYEQAFDLYNSRNFLEHMRNETFQEVIFTKELKTGV